MKSRAHANLRIAVTGASGFIGGVLARALVRRGHAVFAFGRRPAGDIADSVPNYRQWILPDQAPDLPAVDAVIHCAARVGDWGETEDYRRVNVDGTSRVMEAFADASRFIHVSSASVYSPDQPRRRLSEDAAVGDGLYTAYARSKMEAEKLLLDSGRRVVILRPHIVYGPGDRTLLPRLLAARRFGCLPVPGDGCSTLSVTHVLNFAHAVECVLAHPEATGIFNIADAEAPSLNELLRTFLKQNDAPARLLHLPRALAWGGAVASEWLWRVTGRRNAPRLTRYLVAHVTSGHTLDLSRAYRLLGYTPGHDIYSSQVAGGFA